jgi:hypothetical protein
MKKKRRVEFQIERNEISIFAGPGALGIRSTAPASAVASGLIHRKTEKCPTCGSPDMILLSEYVTASGTDLSTLQQRISGGTLHLHCAQVGEWWVCTESFHRS